VVGLRQTAIPVGGAVAAFTLPTLAVAVDWRFAIACAGAVVLVASVPVVLSAPAGGGARPVAVAPAARRRRADPLGSLRRFGRDGVGGATAWGMVLVAAQYGTVTYGILLLHDRFGMSTGQAALVVGLAQLAGATGRVGWVLVGDRVFPGRPERTMGALTLLGVAGCAVVVALPAAASPVVVAVAFLITGVAVTGWPGLWVSYVSTHTPPARVGASMGYGNALVNLAALSGPPILGAVLDATGDHRSLWAVMGLGLAASLLCLRFVAASPGGPAHAVH
jgi:predicted MFS family arabinose efflux permease